MNKLGWAIAIALLLGIALGLMFSGRNDVTAAPNVVNTFNTRSGNVTLTSSDVTSALTFTPANQADLTATNTNLADNYFTKSASDSRFAAFGQVVTSLNNLTGGVTLNAGSNITITSSGNTLTIGTIDAGTSPGQPLINPRRVATLQWYESIKTGGHVTVGNGPEGIAFDGANVWTVNWSSNNVTKIRTSDGANLGTFSVGNVPIHAAFDGANIWVTNSGDNTVTKLRASDGFNLGTFNVGSQPLGIAFDGANIWVTNEASSTVTKLRASDGSNLGVFSTGVAGSLPRGIAFDGANIWVANYVNDFPNGFVSKLRASDGANLGIFAVGYAPFGIAFDGANIWVASIGGGVTKLRASDGFNVGTFSIPDSAFGIVFDGSNIWVTGAEFARVYKLRASDGTILDMFLPGTLPTAQGEPRFLAFDGANVWVTLSVGQGGGSVMKL